MSLQEVEESEGQFLIESSVEDRVEKFHERLGVALPDTSRAIQNLVYGKSAWIVLSGKMCAGKDSLAPLLELPGSKHSIAYGDILRGNLAPALDKWKTLDSAHQRVQMLETELNLKEEFAEELDKLIEVELTLDPEVTPWKRTGGMRTILQRMGSDWLPDPDYLPRTATARAISLLADGDSMVAPGSRFLHDVEIPVLAGAITVRLDVTRETQLRRLKNRDGLDPTPDLLEALDHPGELALDDYPHDIRVSNDDDSPGAFEEVVARINHEIKGILYRRAKETPYRACHGCLVDGMDHNCGWSGH